MVSFEFSTILKYILLNLHIIIGLLLFEISEIFKAIHGLFLEISRYETKNSIEVKFLAH